MYSYYYSSKVDLNIKYFEINWDFFANTGTAFYGYVNQFAVVTILKELKNTNKVGYYSIMVRATYAPILLYSLVCFAGYISFGENIPEFIVLRTPLVGSSDILMSIGQFGVFLAMILAVIIRIRCNRELIQYFLKSAGCVTAKPGGGISKKAGFTINFCLTFGAGFAATFIKTGVSTIVSLISSLVCPYYIFIAPCRNYILFELVLFVLMERFVEFETSESITFRNRGKDLHLGLHDCYDCHFDDFSCC